MASVTKHAPGLRGNSFPRWLPDPETVFMVEAMQERGPRTIVRDATADDVGAIAAIGTVAFPETYRMLADQATIRAIVAQTYALAALRDCIARCARAADGHFLVADRDGCIVGFLHYDCEGQEPELHRIYVDPAQKRRGIGSALLRELHTRLAPGTSYILMVVADNRPAVAFYRHHGFVEQARVDGVAYSRYHMGVEFAPGTPEVPALLLRFTKPG